MIPDPNRIVVARDSVRFHHPVHDKPRTGVVIRIQDERFIVIFGRGTDLGKPHVKVEHPSRAATAIDLNKPTYFYASSIVLVRRAAAPYVGHCPPEIWEKLNPLALDNIRLMMRIA